MRADYLNAHMPIITVRNLDKIGRFGNQLFLYVFAKAYARKMRCDFQCPGWIGRTIFENATEPLVTVQLPQTESDSRSSKPVGYFFGKTNIDINVFGQHHKYLAAYSRADVRQWLTLKPEFEAYAPQKPAHYSAMHLRRGDYSRPPLDKFYCTVSDESYERAIQQFNIPKPIIRVFEGWRQPIETLERHGIAWLNDFLLLRDADYLLRGNSSFSWWAAALGNGKVFAPVVEDMVGLQHAPFVEGNHPCTAGHFRNQSDLHIRE